MADYSEKSHFWVWFPVIFIIFFLLRIFDINPFSNEIKAYMATCEVKVELNSCSQHLYTDTVYRYKVSPERQDVITFGDLRTERYKDCAVKDKANWQCTYDDKSGTFGFNNGRYFSVNLTPSILQDLMDRTYYPSRLEYLRLKTQDSNNNPLVFLISALFE